MLFDATPWTWEIVGLFDAAPWAWEKVGDNPKGEVLICEVLRVGSLSSVELGEVSLVDMFHRFEELPVELMMVSELNNSWRVEVIVIYSKGEQMAHELMELNMGTGFLTREKGNSHTKAKACCMSVGNCRMMSYVIDRGRSEEEIL